MKLSIPADPDIAMDRDGTLNLDFGRQGFVVRVDGLTIHFSDEADAGRLALLICRRLGIGETEERKACVERAREVMRSMDEDVGFPPCCDRTGDRLIEAIEGGP